MVKEASDGGWKPLQRAQALHDRFAELIRPSERFSTHSLVLHVIPYLLVGIQLRRVGGQKEEA